LYPGPRTPRGGAKTARSGTQRCGHGINRARQRAPSSAATARSLAVEIESAIDLNGFLQLAPTRAGLQGVKATLRVNADADDGVLDEIRRVVTQASPVYDSVSNPVAIESSIERVR
jgi:hypothetical protein